MLISLLTTTALNNITLYTEIETGGGGFYGKELHKFKAMQEPEVTNMLIIFCFSRN